MKIATSRRKLIQKIEKILDEEENDLSYYLNMTWTRNNLEVYENLDDKLRDSDVLFFSILESFLKNESPSELIYMLQKADEDVVHRNVVKISQKYPELIPMYARYMTKNQILHFIKTNKPSIIEKLSVLGRNISFYPTRNSILGDIDVQKALYPIIPDRILRNLDKEDPKAILQLGEAINWDKKFYDIIPMITKRSVRDVIVNSYDFPRDFQEKVEYLTKRINQEEEQQLIREEKERERLRKEREERKEIEAREEIEEIERQRQEKRKRQDDGDEEYEVEEENPSRERELWETEEVETTFMTTSTLSDYNYLFKHNIHKLALNSYSGSKKSVLALFTLYSNIVDIRSNTFNETLKKSFKIWKTILKEQSNHFTPDERIVSHISESLKLIENFIKNLPSVSNFQADLDNKIKLYKTSRYHTLVNNLISYMVSFFAHLGIKVKPLPIVSEVTGIKLIALTTEKEDLRDELPLVNAIKEKAKKDFLKANKIKTQEKNIEGVRFYQTSSGFLSLDTLKTYSTKEELIADVKKDQIIDSNYSKVVLDQGKIINPNNNKVLKTIPFLDSNQLESKIEEYQSILDKYNANLKSYEAPLNNEPKTFKVGDHSFNVVKISYKNTSRFVVVSGKYMGHFVDDLVSSTGEVVGSESKASTYLIETSKVMKDLTGYGTSEVLLKPLEDSRLKILKNVTPSKELKILNEREYDDLFRYARHETQNFSLTKKKLENLTGFSIISKINAEATITLNSFNGRINHGVQLPDLDVTILQTIHMSNNKPESIHIDLFATDNCFPDGLGSRVFVQQVKTASEMGFEYIDLMAARSSYFVGYFVWPKLGFDVGMSLSDIEQQLSPSYKKDIIKFEYLVNWLKKNNINPRGEIPISAIYACKAGNRFIGQELWKKYGEATTMKFDLTTGSLSMRILESYIFAKSKKDNIDPSEFLNIEYSKFNTLGLECLVKSKENKSLKDVIKVFKNSVKNYENGELVRIYKNPKTREKLLNLIHRISQEDTDLVNQIMFILKQKGHENIKLASDEQQSEDPILRELDMEILDQIWSGISKQYIQ
jgi:hypothetical protein